MPELSIRLKSIPRKKSSLLKIVKEHLKERIQEKKCALCGKALTRVQKSFICKNCTA